jgi:hypothetical protein
MLSSFGTGATWRLFATFDGTRDIKPMHASKAFTLT